MGQKAKIGKQRKDRFYRLAKETGFRSRAAFKLLQLNRKFGFLEKSRVLIDLCAAPGGWMQVAKQNMPVSSLIVGVDLFPIKPIPGCISLVEDITTAKCKSSLTKALQSWKADIVLHDGAPNVGTNWLLDAYQQACLTLNALKLATEFLREGGWFITKVFRSNDYNSLLWVFKQLFKKVTATKPQASRNESAEIFVICQYYKAPDKLDPKFLQPQYVFKELDLDPSNTLTIFNPKNQKKKAKAEGYVEGNYTCFTSVNVSDFLKSDNAIGVLQKATEIVFDDEKVLNHPKTTNEIKECFKDIKVLNRKDVRCILTWWTALRNEAKAKEKEEAAAAAGNAITQNGDKEQTEEINLSDEDEKELDEIEKQIYQLKKEEMKEQKKKKKVADKERRKLQEKMNLKMIVEKYDTPGLQDESEMFRLSLIKSNKQLNQVLEQKPDVLAESEDDSDDDKPKPKLVKYNKEETHLDSSGKFYKESDSEPESEDEKSSIDSDEGLGFHSDSDSDDDVKKAKTKTVPGAKNENPLLTDLDPRKKKEKRLSKAALWFEKESLKNLATEADEDYDLDVLSQNLKRKGKTVVGEEEPEPPKETTQQAVKSSQKKKKKDELDEEGDSDFSSDSDSSEDSDDGKKRRKKKGKGGDAAGDGTGKKGQKRKLDEEGLAMGSLMVYSKKKKRDLIDGAWNRYAFNDENLPDWFVQDEKEHMTLPLPVPAEMVKEYRGKLKEINVRPIKKIVEAKARKKRRMLKALQKAKKKMEATMDNEDLSEREKVRNIQKLYKKAKAKKKSEVTYVVAKKANTAKRFKRPRGVKGPYKVVDARMKKDAKRMKSFAKKGKSGGKRGKSNTAGKQGKSRKQGRK